MTATKEQINTYAYKSGFIHGQEYETHWLTGLVATAGGTYTAQLVTFSGDSTTAGTNVTAPYLVDQMFAEVVNDRGIQGITTANAGHVGMGTAAWLSTYLATDLATNPDVYIVRWGINDPLLGLTAAQTIANIRSGLATIRGSKTVDQMTVVLEMPSSTNDNPNGRDRAYYELLRNGFAQAAQDYQAVFVDIYGALVDSDFTTACMDQPFQVTPGSSTPIIHIHPANCKNTLYNGLLVDALLPSGTAQLSSNKVWNTTGSFATPLSTALPNATTANGLPVYPKGVSIYRASASAWPYDGQVVTFNQADGIYLQMNMPYSASTTQVIYRTSHNGTSWNAWASYSTDPNWTANSSTLTGTHPCLGIIEFTQQEGFFGQFGEVTQFGVNRNPCTGTFFDVNSTAAAFTMTATTGGSSVIDFYTSSTVNSAPTKRFSMKAGLSVGSANVATDPGDGNMLLNAVIIVPSTPADNATCTAGTFYADASFIYVCTASGTVKRAALSTF